MEGALLELQNVVANKPNTKYAVISVTTRVFRTGMSSRCISLGSLPADVLARIVVHLSRMSAETTLLAPSINRRFREACMYAETEFNLYDGCCDQSHVGLIRIHRTIAARFPRTRKLSSSIMLDVRIDAEESVRALATALSRCRCLKSLIINSDQRLPLVQDEMCIVWQKPIADALAHSPPLKVLGLDLPSKSGSENECARLFEVAGRRIETLEVYGVWFDQLALATISRKMPNLSALCMDPGLLTFDMAAYGEAGSLLSDVLSAARYHWAEALLPVNRLHKFIDTWTPDFWFNGCRLIEWAVTSDNFGFVRVLLERGASPHRSSSRSPSTPLLAAIEARNVNTAKLLLKHGASPNESSGVGDRYPIHAAVGKENMAIIALLFEYKVDPHVPGRHGMTAMSIAARKGSLAIINQLWDFGVPADNLVPNTRQPLSLACEFNQNACVNALLAHGARKESMTPDTPCMLIKSIKKGHIAVTETLLRHGADPDASFRDVTAMGMAIFQRSVALVTILIVFGADINALTLENPATGVRATPLHRAISVESFRIVDLLLLHGADTSILAGDGSAPMHRAVKSNKASLVGTLLQYGADPNIKHGITLRPALPEKASL